MTTDTQNNQKEYEILYFLAITLDDKDIKDIKQKINDIISKYNGNIIKEEEIGKKKLAYAIGHARHGHYVLTIFNTTTDQIANINHEIELMPEVQRHKIVIKEHIKTIDPSRVAPQSAGSPSPTAPTVEKPKEKPKEKVAVDAQELDRKIDELLGEDNI